MSGFGACIEVRARAARPASLEGLWPSARHLALLTDMAWLRRISANESPGIDVRPSDMSRGAAVAALARGRALTLRAIGCLMGAALNRRRTTALSLPPAHAAPRRPIEAN